MLAGGGQPESDRHHLSQIFSLFLKIVCIHFFVSFSLSTLLREHKQSIHPSIHHPLFESIGNFFFFFLPSSIDL
uniref:Uncharacterized protein n=1 Tax=Caenorhabditis japonica TaxID=281687 RepID=A0A8R1EQB2_CAEJA